MIKAAYNAIVRDRIPLDVGENTILNIATNSVTTSTHGFHKYPAKFIPHVPRWAIEKYLGNCEGKCVLDPFCGSGTTLVEGLLCGHNVVGIDIDPLSVLITKAKTTPIDPTRLLQIYSWLVEEVSMQRRRWSFKPASSNLNHWFTKDAIDKLSLIRGLIDDIPATFGNSQQNSDIAHLFLVCFSSIIRRVSNADNECQKTYVSHTKVKEPEEAISLFTEQLSLFKERIIDFSKRVNPGLRREIIRTVRRISVKNWEEGI
jgi:SAM-dependent methyltransferase